MPPDRLTRIDTTALAAVFVGGACGALARVGLDLLLPTPAGTWPWATVAINLSGSLLLGFVATRLLDGRARATYLRPLLGTGLCGTYTTFATMQVELLKMFDHDRAGLAAAYAAASVAAGLIAVALGTRIARRTRRPR
jgi:CrcB protein